MISSMGSRVGTGNISTIPTLPLTTVDERVRRKKRITIMFSIILAFLIIAGIAILIVVLKMKTTTTTTTVTAERTIRVATTTTSAILITSTRSESTSPTTPITAAPSTASASTIATLSTKTTTTTTALASPSTICSTNTSNAYLYNKQFIYSPTHQLYAAGMLNNQFGVYIADGYNNVTPTALWTAGQSSTPTGASFAAQSDRNLVVYTSTGGVLWAANTYVIGLRAVFCLEMLVNGNLIWVSSGNTIIWQSNSAVASG